MKVITIVGPTAVGKTQIAINIAQKISGEIISADSRQIYKNLNIGTAKPTPEEQKLVQFHLIDFVLPDTSYSCGQFARNAEKKIAEICLQSKQPIVCGGTGLYIRALFHPLHKLPESDKDVKEKLVTEMNTHGIKHLYERLLRIDPAWARKIMPADKQRILRGLEVYEISGKTMSSLTQFKRKESRYLPYYMGLTMPRDELYQRINKRFDNMIENGLVKETEFLLEKGLDPTSSALRTLGYKEVIEYLQGQLTLDEAIDKAKRRTRNFAKRQIAWFNNVQGIQWYDAHDPDLVDHFISTWKRANEDCKTTNEQQC